MAQPRKFRVLVIDDEPDILESIELMLKEHRHIEVMTAQTAEHAVSLLSRADGVIADCVLPQISELENSLRRSGKPVIRMSGRIFRASNLEISKPFTEQQLLDSVEMLQFFSNANRSPGNLKRGSK